MWIKNKKATEIQYFKKAPKINMSNNLKFN